MKVYQPLNHYDYTELDSRCACIICQAWREKHNALAKQSALTKAHHYIECNCEECSKRMLCRTEYLSALNKRDLYCEASWHANQLERYNNVFDFTIADPVSGFALIFMNWLSNEIKQKNDSWWEVRGLLLPLQHWFDKFAIAVIVSGKSLGIPAPWSNEVTS